MADLYLDHGAYGTSTNRLGLDAPATWGVPQEGDGGATSASTAAAVAEIKINASPTASETITIAGAVITAAAAAGANAFVRGANPAATATNIVTLINSANFTNTVGTSVAHNTGIGPLANQGRNLMYAQVKGGATDTVQIMFRIGSDALNYANNSNVAITSSGWGTPPTITQFTGGVSGCFGWLLNPVALGKGSTITVNQYGVLMAKPTVVRGATSANSVYAIGYADNVWLRSGAGNTIATTFAGSISRVASSNDLHLILDSNTKWTGDGGTGVFTVNVTPPGGGPIYWTLGPASSRIHLESLVAEKFKIRQVSSATSSINVVTAGSVLENTRMLWEEDNAVPSGNSLYPCQWLVNNSANLTARYRQTVFSFQRSQSTGRQICSQLGGNNSFMTDAEFLDCEVRQNYSGVANPTAGVAPLYSSNNGNTTFRWRAGKITGIGSYRQPMFSGSWPSGSGSYFFTLSAESVKGADVLGTGVANWVAWSAGVDPDIRTTYQSTAESGRSRRWENIAGATDWISNASPAYPTLNGRMLDNTAYSYRVLWLYGTGQDRTRAYTVPRMSQTSRGATGAKTILLEMLVPTAATLTRDNIEFFITYVDNSGNVVTEAKNGTDVVASAASWSGAGNYPNHSAKKLTFTTSAQIAQYSDVALIIKLRGDSPTGSAADLYVDPGFTLS